MAADAGRLTDPALYAVGDPFELYAELRRTAPVCWVEREGGGFWAVTTHPEVSSIGADPVGFCSSRGILIDEIGTTSSASPAWRGSSSSRAFAVTPASISRTIDGLNPGWTRRR